MIRFLFFSTFLLFSAATFAQPLHPCAELVWHDEFDGTALDASKWTPQIGDGCDINLCGWGNDELQYYTGRPENVKVESGNLVITALKEPYSGRDYTSAKIRSIQKGDFTFGRIEARIKVPEGQGSWPAFWMLPTDETYGPWPKSGEIDIMEFQGKTPNMVSGTVHYGGTPTHVYKGLPYYLPSGEFYYDDFHTFTLDWDSTSIKWYMDGNLYHTFTKNNSLPYKWPFDQRFYIILNNAIGGHLGGPVDDASMPQTMLVDYVKVYSSPGNFNLIGKQQLFVNTLNEPYYIPDIPDAIDYQWTVPTGASIVSGQGSSQIRVNWGGLSSAGNVALTVVKNCGSFDLTLPVRLTDDGSCNLVLDNMDGATNVNYDSWTATNFYTSYNNPNKTAGNNSSAKVGYLIKNSLNGTNQFVLGQVPITDFSVYESGARVFTMDVYTSAAPGTTVELRFLNKSKAQGTYPGGVRTVLSTKTSLLRTWETLVFKFDHIEDMTTLISEIDQMAIVFNPENTLINKYFAFDNLTRSLLPYNAIDGNTTIENCDVVNSIYSVNHDAASTYTWTVPAGFTINGGQGTHDIDVSWSGMPSGRIYVKETKNGCSSYTGTLDIKVSPCTGILNPESIKALKIFPNPSKDQLTVACDLPATTDVKLIISSSLGETLVTKNYPGQNGMFEEQFSIQDLQPGSYIIQLVTGSDIHASQLIKY